MRLWLDDVRIPPPGWTWAKTAKEAREHLATGLVQEASLDHDLGGEVQHVTDSGILVAGAIESALPTENGTALVRWMVETGHWPRIKPRVHSANPVGAMRMREMIEAHWRPRE